VSGRFDRSRDERRPRREAEPDLGALRRLRLWLAPGMGVKRHVALAVAGGLLAALGAVAGVLWLLADARASIAQPVERVLVSPPWRAVGGALSLAALLGGVALTAWAIVRLNRSLLSNWMPRPRDAAVVLHRRLLLSRGPRIVAFGGGTGLSNLLRGLRMASSNLTAVVAVSDDGGSSGRLRRAFGMPAPGDLSDCLAALSDHEVELGRLMDYRFERGEALAGHTFGNLLITTLSEVEGDLGRATRVLNRVLHLAGAVWPATADSIALVATKRDGVQVAGESRLREHPGPVGELALDPPDPPALPEVVAAIHDADLIVLGPGSLFTSVIAPLLVPQVRAALEAAPAPLVYVCNIMTEAGETDGMDAFAHVRALHAHLGRWPDLVLVNDAPVDPDRLAAYRREEAEEVEVRPDRFAQEGVAVRSAPLVGRGPFAQHDPTRLAEELLGLAVAARAGEVLR
jgi:uncharacterized cofD-like protein